MTSAIKNTAMSLAVGVVRVLIWRRVGLRSHCSLGVPLHLAPQHVHTLAPHLTPTNRVLASLARYSVVSVWLVGNGACPLSSQLVVRHAVAAPAGPSSWLVLRRRGKEGERGEDLMRYAGLTGCFVQFTLSNTVLRVLGFFFPFYYVLRARGARSPARSGGCCIGTRHRTRNDQLLQEVRTRNQRACNICGVRNLHYLPRW